MKKLLLAGLVVVGGYLIYKKFFAVAPAGTTFAGG